ncbi:alpha/beta hydrolase [Celeribacter indicus]|uniref:AB hydrolase-1 domain-containing protein n=1 Tax=Celeribacter indicus TaxID=1208324 RepID=A0A0B5E5F2_9RHOB|nr:alpha/beta hydrolase [Celeribacter indicus]AJE48201.1 hypothetical protein P73_3486 [Celeribacter indicus]SDW69301.1 Alpha/beta hydrolase of unknown function [Celeribacter indicus]
MPLVKVNAAGSRPAAGDLAALEAALARVPREAPVVICVHGYRFCPDSLAHTPHGHILSLDPVRADPRAVSWPRGLGFTGETPEEGVCVALGWSARGSIWQAAARARPTAEALARVIRRIDRPVHLLAHSLGARVALGALPALPAGAVGRIILLAGAEFRAAARLAMTSEAGRTAEVFNVTSRENALYELLFQAALLGAQGPARTLGAGLGGTLPNWCDLPIDATATRDALARMGFPVPAPDRRVCHWSPYLRAGLFELYRAMLRSPEALPAGLLARAVPQTRPSRRARVFPGPSRALPLSFSRKASS